MLTDNPFSSQYLQFRLAEMCTALIASRLMARHAARALDADAPNHVPLCSAAKLFATEQCSAVSTVISQAQLPPTMSS